MSALATQSIGLGQAVDTPELRWTQFFNGRLLTGEDLAAEQSSNHSARALLAQALGSGVAGGLDVTLAPGAGSAAQPVLKVTAGAAVNQTGDVLELECDTTVALSADPVSDAGSDAGFSVCLPASTDTYAPTTGVFVFTIGGSSSAHGRAPVSGLSDGDAACNVDYKVDGVQFGLVALVLDSSLGNYPDLLRNRLAHLIFGTTDAGRLSALYDPFAHTAGQYGLLDLLPADCIDAGSVPLAVLHWDTTGVTFIDRWAVRRRLTAPIAADRWPTYMADRRRAEAEAMFLQFEDQAEELLAGLAAPQSVTASTYFDYLPPVGLLPIDSVQGVQGFDPKTFFGAQASRDIAEIDAALVPALVHDGLWHEPIAIADGGERIQLYLIRENELAVNSGAAAQAALVFAKRTLSYRGIARFGVARFGLSRFAPRVI